MFRAGAVGAKASQQEDVEVGRVTGRTVLAKHRRQIGTSHADRQGVRRSAVGAWHHWVGTVGEQQLDDLGGAFRPHRGVDHRAWLAVVVEIPAGIGTGLEQQLHPLDVVAAERRGQRHPRDGPHVGCVVEQHPQALVIVVGEAGQVQVVVGRDRAPVEQQPRDRGVRRPRDRAA